MSKQIDAKVAQLQGRIAAKNIELEGYKANLSGETARVNATVAYNSSVADLFKSKVASITSFNEVQVKQWQAAIDQAARVSEIGISAAKANAELYVTTRSLAVEAAKVGAQVNAQLGAAALNAINWSTSFSESNSSGFSISSSYSDSVSDSTSYSENYNYSV